MDLGLRVLSTTRHRFSPTYVSSAENNLAVAQLNQTITVTYSSTTGSALLLQITCSNDEGSVGAVVSVVDSAGNNWAQINTGISEGVDYQELWGVANATAITSVTATVSGTATNPTNGYYLFAGLSEWTGVSAIGASTTNMGNSEPATISQTLISGGNRLVGVFLSSQPTSPSSISSGTLRYSVGFAAGGGHASSSVDTLTYVSGGHFVPPFTDLVSWVGNPITFNGVTYTVASVPSQTSLVLTTSPGTQVNKSWTYNAQGPGNILNLADIASGSASSVTLTLLQGSSAPWNAIAVELISG